MNTIQEYINKHLTELYSNSHECQTLQRQLSCVLNDAMTDKQHTEAIWQIISELLSTQNYIAYIEGFKDSLIMR